MAKRLGQGPADPVYLVDSNGEVASPTNPITITDEWTVSLVSREGVGNDETIAVPAGTEYQILWIYVELTTAAGVPDRQLQIDIQDNDADIIGQIRPGVTQGAGVTYNYMFAPSLADLIAVRDTVYIMTPFPAAIFLPALYQIRIFDNTLLDANDSLDIQMMVASRNA